MKAQAPTYELFTGNSQSSVKALYERYGKKLFLFAQRKWQMKEDDAWDMVYKTIYRVVDTHSSYKFASEEKFSAFVFTVFINYLRNFYRDRKNLPQEITGMDEQLSETKAVDTTETVSPAMSLLQRELDQLEDWERILLLMRSQDVPYSEIAEFVEKPEEQLKVYYQRLRKKLTERLSTFIKTPVDEKSNLKTEKHGKQQ